MMPSHVPVAAAVEEAVAPRARRVVEIVIVAPDCDRFAGFVAAGRRGEVGLHFCVDGTAALRMARRFRADIWLVASSLPDMSGLDLVEMLVPAVARAEAGPVSAGLRSGVFVIADGSSFEDEQRALRAGAAGYLSEPLSMELLREGRGRRVDSGSAVR